MDERFLRKIKFDEKTGCWDWIAGKFSSGYGVFKFKGKNYRAHRFSYEMIIGSIPPKKILHHKCENKACVNPQHLELITPYEHPKRSTNHSINKTHCKQGHEFNEKNTYITPVGKRTCRICNRIRLKEFLRNNPEKSKEYTYRWREKYPEKYKQYMAKYYKITTDTIN